MRAKRHSRKDVPWTLRELTQLGKTPDSILARRRKRTIKETVAEREARRIALPTGPRRWTAREIRMLGRFSDPEVGRRLRRTSGNVRSQRRKLKIPAFKPHKFKLWKPSELRLLGT